jgi:hypothetical protein
MNRVDATRRQLLAALLGSAAALTGTGRLRAQAPKGAAELPHLDETDKMAIAFAYVADAKKVVKTKFPTYKPVQTCANCSQLTGKEGATWRPCKIFPGKSVHAAGWCKVWIKKA